MLHGYGSDEKDLFSFAELLNDRFLVVSLRAPKKLPWGGYAWYDIDFTGSASRFGNPEQALESLQKVNTFIDEIALKYDTNPAETVLLGFSQGAILAYGLAIRHPKKYKRIVALSGYIFKEIMPSEIIQDNVSGLDIFGSHGVVDEIIPVAWARNSQDWLKSNHIHSEYHEYQMGHGINPECFKDMLAWLHKRYSTD